jgi:hypothetical protein
VKKDRNAEVAKALVSLECQHNKANESTDRATGDLFCGDCGKVTIPWSQQTERQHKVYRWQYGADPKGVEA